MKKALALILVTLFATSVMFAQETTKEPKKKAAKTSKTTKATKKPANTKEMKTSTTKPMKK